MPHTGEAIWCSKGLLTGGYLLFSPLEDRVVGADDGFEFDLFVGESHAGEGTESAPAVSPPAPPGRVGWRETAVCCQAPPRATGAPERHLP